MKLYFNECIFAHYISRGKSVCIFDALYVGIFDLIDLKLYDYEGNL